jgi:hypothetical protein
VSASSELQTATDVERQLATLLLNAPSLSELPIAPLRSIDDLVRLEIALHRFAEFHRSKRSKMLVGRVRRILRVARARLRREVEVQNSEARGRCIDFPDTQPAQ